jgi:hypothetical protein
MPLAELVVMSRPTLVALALLALAGCSGPVNPAETPQPDRNAPGVFFTYDTSTGNVSETITVYLVSTMEVAVIRKGLPCAPAKYHTALIDPVSGEPERIVLGELTPDATQARYETILTDRASGVLRRQTRSGEPAATVPVPAWPWLLWDLRLGDWALSGPRGPDARHGFSFGLAETDGGLAWPARIFDRGEIRASFEGVRILEDGAGVNLFRLIRADGSSFGAIGLDPVYGHLVDGRIGAPGEETSIRLQATGRGRAEFYEGLFSGFEACADVDPKATGERTPSH